MRKEEFLTELRKGISKLPQAEIDERLEFYSEMIDDLVEEGISENDAIEQIGSVDEIISKIVADIPHDKMKKDSTQRRNLRAWEIVLIALGSPIWISLAIAAIAVILSIYISLWCVIISLWAVFASFVGCALGTTLIGIVHAIVGNPISCIAMIGIGLICAGISIFLFFGCKVATKGAAILTKKITSSIITRKEKI